MLRRNSVADSENIDPDNTGREDFTPKREGARHRVIRSARRGSRPLSNADSALNTSHSNRHVISPQKPAETEDSFSPTKEQRRKRVKRKPRAGDEQRQSVSQSPTPAHDQFTLLSEQKDLLKNSLRIFSTQENAVKPLFISNLNDQVQTLQNDLAIQLNAWFKKTQAALNNDLGSLSELARTNNTPDEYLNQLDILNAQKWSVASDQNNHLAEILEKLFNELEPQLREMKESGGSFQARFDAVLAPGRELLEILEQATTFAEEKNWAALAKLNNPNDLANCNELMDKIQAFYDADVAQNVDEIISQRKYIQSQCNEFYRALGIGSPPWELSLDTICHVRQRSLRDQLCTLLELIMPSVIAKPILQLTTNNDLLQKTVAKQLTLWCYRVKRALNDNHIIDLRILANQRVHGSEIHIGTYIWRLTELRECGEVTDSALQNALHAANEVEAMLMQMVNNGESYFSARLQKIKAMQPAPALVQEQEQPAETQVVLEETPLDANKDEETKALNSVLTQLNEFIQSLNEDAEIKTKPLQNFRAEIVQILENTRSQLTEPSSSYDSSNLLKQSKQAIAKLTIPDDAYAKTTWEKICAFFRRLFLQQPYKKMYFGELLSSVKGQQKIEPASFSQKAVEINKFLDGQTLTR